MRKQLNSKRKRIRHLDIRHRMRSRLANVTMTRRRETRRKVSQADPRHNGGMDDIGSIGARDLAQLLSVPLRTAQRWIAQKRLPAGYRRLYALLTTGQLGELWPAWRGFKIVGNKLVTDDGFELGIQEI